MIKKILITLLFVLLTPISFAQAYGWTTDACKATGCDCVGTSVEGQCKLTGDCSKCKTPICKTRPSLGGTACYLFDQAECDEVYDAYKDCSSSCKNLMDQFANDCRKDTTGKGDYLKIPIGACCSNPPKAVETIMQKVSGRTVTLKGDPIPNVKVLIQCVNAVVVQSNITSDATGFFDPSVQSEKGKDVTCKMIIGNEDQIRVRLTNVKPGEIGDIKLGTIAEYELSVKTALMQMLIDSGIDRGDAVNYVAYIKFNYSGGNPSFGEVTPSYLTGKIYGANYEITMDPQMYLTDRETLYHEMTHAIAQKMFPDISQGGGSHDIYEPLSPAGAFDEARAHFMAYLMLKRMGEYDPAKDQFQDEKTITGITGNKVDIAGGQGASVEGSVATFLKDYYVNVAPADALRDYLQTVNGCKATLGHSCQTINEFINQKGFVDNGVQADAAKLGIKVDKDGTCIVKKNSSYTVRDSKTIQLDSGDVECGSKDIKVNDIEIVHGGTQYVVFKTGSDTTIAVLAGLVKATDVNSKETADIAAGNKVTYNSSTEKFSSPVAIDVNSIEKFWVTDVQNGTSNSLFYPLLAAVFVIAGAGAILLARKSTKKS